MTRLLGPILGFHGIENGEWKVSVLTVRDDAAQPALQWWSEDGKRNNAANPVLLLEHNGRRVLRQDITVLMTEAEQTVTYSFSGEQELDFRVPALDQAPRMTFCSCNGFSNPRDKKKVPDHNAMWKSLGAKHVEKDFHLMLMGGDQVYADSLWETVESIKAWVAIPETDRLGHAFTNEMDQQTRKFYFDLYVENWSQPERQNMFARIPSVMMWDDHDIFDGWGSYKAALHNCPVYQGIFKIAREHFQAFQLRSDGKRLEASFLDPNREKGNVPTFCSAHSLGNLGLLVLDLRSERTETQVMSPDTWELIYGALARFEDKDCDHLLVVTSIPVVHPDFGLIEGGLGFLPGQQELEDDLRDHWHSRPHKDERRRLIHRLLSFSASYKTRVTMLSGDVHVGAIGVIETNRDSNAPKNAGVINQLTSSAIVHPPPPAIMAFTLERMGASVETVERGITASMLELPGTRKRFIGARNWLSLEPDDKDKGQKRIWANWHVEGEATPFTKVIHTCEGS